MHINRPPTLWLKKQRFDSLGAGEAEKSNPSAFISQFNRSVSAGIKSICHGAAAVLFVTEHCRRALLISVSSSPELGDQFLTQLYSPITRLYLPIRILQQFLEAGCRCFKCFKSGLLCLGFHLRSLF